MPRCGVCMVVVGKSRPIKGGYLSFVSPAVPQVHPGSPEFGGRLGKPAIRVDTFFMQFRFSRQRIGLFSGSSLEHIGQTRAEKCS
jgi:hypothetical protein